jgi:hypothetical protein
MSNVRSLMEQLLIAVLAILRWRVVVTVAVALGLAVLCVRSLPWFSGVQGITLVFASYFVGLAWESHAHGVPLVAPDATRKTALPVAALACVFGGSVWGVLSSTSVGPAVTGATLLLVGLGIWGWYAVLRKRTILPAHAVLYSCSLVVGYAIPIALITAQ